MSLSKFKNSKLLFLDIDGVMNSTVSTTATGENFPLQMNPMSVLILFRLIQVSDAKIVMSSSWRNDENYPDDFMHYIHKAGWPESVPVPLVDRTPVLGPQDTRRGEEVELWLRENEPNASAWHDYVILDDSTNFFDSQPLVHVDPDLGLTHREFWLAIHKWNVDRSKLTDILYDLDVKIQMKRKLIKPRDIYTH